MNLLDIAVLLIVLLLAQGAIAFYSKGKPAIYRKDLQNLWLYHSFFGIVYYVYVLNFGGDARGYWNNFNLPLSRYIAGGAGTAFVHVLNYPFVSLGLSFFTGSMMYAFIGYLGIIYFYLTARKLLKANVKINGYSLFPLVFFLPNLHFWSAGVGKDTLSFFCVGLFIYSLLNLKSRFVGVILSLYLVYFVRPHMAIFILAAFGVGSFFDKRLKIGYKVVLSFGFAVAAVMLFDSVLEYAKIDEVSTENIEQFSSTRVANLSGNTKGSSVDISSYPYPFKVFTFLFRPLFIDAHNLSSLLTSVENLVLLYLTLLLFKAKPVKSFLESPYQVKALAIFVIVGSLAFSNILGNMGIMVRMKNMFIPPMLIFICWTLGYRRESNRNNENLLKEEKQKRRIRLVGSKFFNQVINQ